MERPERDDYQQIEYRKTDVDHLAVAHLLLLAQVLALVEMQKVVAERRGQRRQRAVGTAVAGSHHTQHETDQRESAQRLCNGRIDLVGQHTPVGAHRHLKTRSMRTVIDQCGAKRQKDEIDDDKQKTGRDDILLRIAQRLASQVLLHHILIQSRHSDSDERPRHNLFPVVLRMVHIRLPNTGIALVGAGAEQFRDAHSQVLKHNNHRRYCRQQQKSGLQRVGPDNRLQAAAESVEQNQRYKHHRRHPERHAPMAENKLVQHKDNQIHTQCRPQQARQDEEQGPRLFGRAAKALIQIRIDRSQIQPIIERQEKERNDKIANHIAENQRHIGEGAIVHPAGNRHKRHARQRRPQHTIGHHGPRRFAARPEESIIARRAARRQPHHKKKQRRV